MTSYISEILPMFVTFNTKRQAMKGRIVLLSATFVFLILAVSGCGKRLDSFTFTYTMESVGNYKMTLTVGSDKAYRIEELNYFQAKHTGKLIPKITEGSLADDELDSFSRLLAATDFFSMKDNYGFDKDAPSLNIMYQISLQTGGKEKYISIRNAETGQFPVPFLQLLDYINAFISKRQIR